MKHEAQVFGMASQSAPKYKQRILFTLTFSFCFLLFNQHIVCDEKCLCVFHNLSLHVYLHASASLLSRNMHAGLAEYESGFSHPKLCKKNILCLHSGSLKVQSTI